MYQCTSQWVMLAQPGKQRLKSNRGWGWSNITHTIKSFSSVFRDFSAIKYSRHMQLSNAVHIWKPCVPNCPFYWTLFNIRSTPRCLFEWYVPVFLWYIKFSPPRFDNHSELLHSNLKYKVFGTTVTSYHEVTSMVWPSQGVADHTAYIRGSPATS